MQQQSGACLGAEPGADLVGIAQMLRNVACHSNLHQFDRYERPIKVWKTVPNGTWDLITVTNERFCARCGDPERSDLLRVVVGPITQTSELPRLLVLR